MANFYDGEGYTHNSTTYTVSSTSADFKLSAGHYNWFENTIHPMQAVYPQQPVQPVSPIQPIQQPEFQPAAKGLGQYVPGLPADIGPSAKEQAQKLQDLFAGQPAVNLPPGPNPLFTLEQQQAIMKLYDMHGEAKAGVSGPAIEAAEISVVEPRAKRLIKLSPK